jgi:RNA polymerase sigma factor (sigma-70 family)
VKNHVLKNSGNSDDASDVFQDTIITLYKQVRDNSLELTSDLKGYFFGIARNVWSTMLRKRRNTQEISTDFAVEEDEGESNNLMFEGIVTRAFDKLKPDNQVVLNLFADGISYEEIAFKLDLKNETYARRKKYLAKEALMELVKEDPEYQEYLRFHK